MSSLARGTFMGIAAFALIANGLLLLGASVPAWVFPVAVLAGIACAFRGAARPRAPRGFVEWTTALALLVTLCALCYGCLSTSSREWDGVVAWELKAKVLAEAPTGKAAYFSEPQVYAHSRDYPLLQPLCQASLAHWLGERGGRLLFPFLWLVLVGLCARASPRPLVVLGAALMPALVSPGGGAVDSGYGELFLVTSLAAIAAGLLSLDKLLLLAGAIVMLLVKPEGPYYGAALALAMIGRWGCLLVPVICTAGFLWMNLTITLLAATSDLPRIALAGLSHALLPHKFGLTYVLLIAVVYTPRRVVGPCPAPVLGRFLMYGLALVACSFLVRGAEGLEHHIQSSMSRLLLQWSIPAWLLASAWETRVRPFSPSSWEKRV